MAMAKAVTVASATVQQQNKNHFKEKQQSTSNDCTLVAWWDGAFFNYKRQQIHQNQMVCITLLHPEVKSNSSVKIQLDIGMLSQEEKAKAIAKIHEDVVQDEELAQQLTYGNFCWIEVNHLVVLLQFVDQCGANCWVLLANVHPAFSAYAPHLVWLFGQFDGLGN